MPAPHSRNWSKTIRTWHTAGRSHCAIARKHGKSAMDILCDLMLGTPWQPPAHSLSP
jgi:hypothetical protein